MAAEAKRALTGGMRSYSHWVSAWLPIGAAFLQLWLAFPRVDGVFKYVAIAEAMLVATAIGILLHTERV